MNSYPEILSEKELNSASIKNHVLMMDQSYRHWFIDSPVPSSDAYDLSLKLYHAPFAYFSIDDANEPAYNYMNLRAQNLFEIGFNDLPRFSLSDSTDIKVATNLLNFTNHVKEVGKYVNYTGTRISKKGNLFRIENTYIWSIFDADGNYKGQGYFEPLF